MPQHAGGQLGAPFFETAKKAINLLGVSAFVTLNLRYYPHNEDQRLSVWPNRAVGFWGGIGRFSRAPSLQSVFVCLFHLLRGGNGRINSPEVIGNHPVPAHITDGPIQIQPP